MSEAAFSRDGQTVGPSTVHACHRLDGHSVPPIGTSEGEETQTANLVTIPWLREVCSGADEAVGKRSIDTNQSVTASSRQRVEDEPTHIIDAAFPRHTLGSDMYVPNEPAATDDVSHGEESSASSHLSSQSRASEPYLEPMSNAFTTILDLPYDIIHEICCQLTYLHPLVPPDCTNGTVLSPVTGEEQARLELNSSAFHQIVYFLNGGPARRDLKAISQTCTHLRTLMKSCMQTIHQALLRTRPVCVDQLWFEDLSWMLSELDDYGLASISGTNLYWDNRERIAGSFRADPKHRTEEAAPRTFNILADKCVNLRSLNIRISPEMLRTRRPSGEMRDAPLKSYFDIVGIDELKRLIKCVLDRRGHVKVELAFDDLGYFKDRKKIELIQWFQKP
ncbi:uncharacterized protein PV09_02039 [Verruconis gallopava]|uniref:F-box domain-containing protein n=1 Tax=Verruconis gallopava TaxID=253628 RepID=A0A0D2AKT7_9PEZI|nr:uncharacterized protein PV09_02039 [Verruconis gallopava]KIW07170.1 hypothetical protein PV09_02039 [Verruconis gallopava]